MSAKKAPVGAAKTQSYRAAFEQLARIAAELEAGETDLDKVLPLLNEAQAAYEQCRQRIEALRSALEQVSALNLKQDLTQDLTQDAAPREEQTDDEPDDEDDFF